MDELIKQLLQGEIFWYETKPTRTAFAPYCNTPRQVEPGRNDGGNSENMNKKMIGFLKKSWPATVETKDGEKERCFRHMMNERIRREKQKRSYSALHSMLPLGTKNDKNSIVQTATRRVRELEWLRKDLERRNYELKSNHNNKIGLKVENPTSGIDSMLETLNCLKELDSNPTIIQSNFTPQQVLAVLVFPTQGEAAKVENALDRTLQETGRKLQGPRNGPTPFLIHK
ncbi:hypothetical protein E1A91_A09G242600v1 [Gossypium mustelinum]|uniref:BHLH domain-containing protein n=1 Tax=Gossypium mustelinum TaxID=34275 RepID=A0A5D2Y1R6_GOSMU|nr:hypothetical protein E1A91_A09G242600v1 [Gossypium mustelinum]